MKGLRTTRFLFFLLLYSYSMRVLCQNNPRVFQHFKSDNGLSQNAISCINQDSDGYIWIANDDGISRFDGHTCRLIKNSTKDSAAVLYADYLFKDHLGRIWMLTSNQLMRYDPLSGKTIYFSDDDAFKKSIRADVTSVTEDKSGMMWIGTRNGLYQYEEQKNKYTRFVHDTIGPKRAVYCKNRVRDLLYDQHGTIWVAAVSGLYKFSLSSHQFTSVFKTTDSPNSNMDDVISMVFTKNGTIWLSIIDGGIRVIDTTTNALTYINTKTTNNQLNSNNTGKLLCDRNGNIWIAHVTKGINIYHPQTNQFESYRHDESDSHSLGDDRTTTLFEDKTGMIWIGTLSEGADGVSAIAPKFNTYIQHPGVPNTLCEKGITCVTEDKSANLWIGSENGLMFFNRTTNLFTCFHHEDNNPNSLSHDYVKAVKMDRDGMLWVGTSMGLNKYNPATGKWKSYLPDRKIPSSFPSDVVNGIYERSNGELWISSNNCICKYIPEKECFENSYTNPIIALLKPEFYTAIFEDSRKTMWLATSRSGVYQLDDSFKVLHWYRYSDKKPNGIPGNYISQFDEDKNGNIWMSTAYGACKLDVKTQQFTTYGIEQGLPGDLITQLKIADDGIIWLGSDKGLTQLSFDTKGKAIVKNFTVSDGLQSNVFYVSAALKLRSGELFFGGSKGFTFFKPEKTIFNQLVPEVKLSSFSIFDKELNSFPTLHSQNNIKLDYQQNFFSFDMAAMSFDYPEKNQYAYQLEGFDKKMIYCGTHNHVSYTNVPPGVYTLHIIASNNDGLWNLEGTRIKIEITPPFWKTWWFRIISSALLLISFTLLVRYIFTVRLKKKLAVIEQQREIENVRSRISRDIHDEIGSGLTRISLLSELVKSNADKKNNDIPLLEKIITSSREISSSLSEIIWTVNPEHDNLESLLSYMRHYIHKFFEDAEVAYKIEFPEEVPANYINPDLKRNLFLILKESLNNIIKHSLAGNVAVTFSITNKQFRLTIADDGIGIQEDKKSMFGNGMRNMHSRAESIHAECRIESLVGKGTVIIIEGILSE